MKHVLSSTIHHERIPFHILIVIFNLYQAIHSIHATHPLSGRTKGVARSPDTKNKNSTRSTNIGVLTSSTSWTRFLTLSTLSSHHQRTSLHPLLLLQGVDAKKFSPSLGRDSISRPRDGGLSKWAETHCSVSL